MIRLTGGNPVLVPCPPVCRIKLTPRALREAIGRAPAAARGELLDTLAIRRHPAAPSHRAGALVR